MTKTGVILKIAIMVILGLAACFGVCYWIGFEEYKSEFLKAPPWMLFPALATAPAVVLTWYWRHMNSWERLITERFAKATEMLGNERLEQRIGAIYQLERIAEDSPRDHWTVMETLCAFVRENARWTKEDHDEWKKRLSIKDEKKEDQVFEIIKLVQGLEPKTDIQAAIRVIGLRKHADIERKDQILDFSGTNLRGIVLDREGMNFKKAVFRYCALDGMKTGDKSINFEDCSFFGSTLCSAHLERNNMAWVSFYDTTLFHTDFIKTDLKSSNFSDVTAREVFFSDIETFTDTIFIKGNFFDCVFSKSNMQNSIFGGAVFEDCDFINAVLRDGSVSNTKLKNCHFGGADLSGMKLLHTTFEGCIYNEESVPPGNHENFEALGFKLEDENLFS